MDKNTLRELCLFILGIYGDKLFAFACALCEKRQVKYLIFITVSFLMVHKFFTIL